MKDIIGDIHGHADQLESLLKKLGYTHKNGSYSHPERTALFVGDYIDRGQKIKETLKIVRDMVETGNAIALMGNHEYNAILFHYNNPMGGHLRKHSIKNILQHSETIKQFSEKQKEYNDYISWFKILPLFYESDNYRAVHACWDQASIDFLREILPEARLTDELIFQSAEKSSKLYGAVEIVLKGKETAIPGTYKFKDQEGHQREEIRIKWWEDASKSTYKKISVIYDENLPDFPVVLSDLSNVDFYKPDDRAVFFGHYWLTGSPELFRDNVCCLDYSIAQKGKLAAYRYSSESKLDNKNLVYVL